MLVLFFKILPDLWKVILRFLFHDLLFPNILSVSSPTSSLTSSNSYSNPLPHNAWLLTSRTWGGMNLSLAASYNLMVWSILYILAWLINPTGLLLKMKFENNTIFEILLWIFMECFEMLPQRLLRKWFKLTLRAMQNVHMWGDVASNDLLGTSLRIGWLDLLWTLTGCFS